MTKRKRPLVRCPGCGVRKHSSLKTVDGQRVTRCCETPVVTVNKLWYKSHNDAPEWQIMQEFVSMVNTHGPKEFRGTYVIEHGDRVYQSYIKSCRVVFNKCGKDIRLALEFIRQSFTNKRYNWRWNRGNMSFYSILGKDFSAIRASATFYLEKADGEVSRQEARVRAVDPRYREAAYEPATL